MKVFSAIVFLAASILSPVYGFGATQSCDIALHTFLYPIPPDGTQYAYELVPYTNEGQGLTWYLITYSLFPKQEISRMEVQASSSNTGLELYTGRAYNGAQVTVQIETKNSSSVAPLEYSAYVTPDLNGGVHYMAQRLNPQQPKMVGGGILGRLDTCP